MWPPGRVHFWPQGHNLNKPGRGPLGDATYQISRPCGFREDFFSCFPFYKPIYNMWPPGRAHFWPKGHNLIKLGRDPLGGATVLNIKALGHVVSEKKIFSCFRLYKPMLNMWPPGWVHLRPKGHNLNKLGRGSLGDTTYQTSRLCRPCSFRNDFFTDFPIYKP